MAAASDIEGIASCVFRIFHKSYVESRFINEQRDAQVEESAVDLLLKQDLCMTLMTPYCELLWETYKSIYHHDVAQGRFVYGRGGHCRSLPCTFSTAA